MCVCVNWLFFWFYKCDVCSLECSIDSFWVLLVSDIWVCVNLLSWVLRLIYDLLH